MITSFMRCVLEVVCPIVDILAHARNTEFPAVPAVPMGLFVGVTRLGLWVCGCVCGCVCVFVCVYVHVHAGGDHVCLHEKLLK